VALEAEFQRTHSLETAKEIARLEAEYARIVREDHSVSESDAAEQSEDAAEVLDDDDAETYAERIIAVLARSSVPLTAQDICVAIGPPNALPTVRAVLSKLFPGRVERVATGLYRLVAGGGHRHGATDDD
jgi:hypothetical protein